MTRQLVRKQIRDPDKTATTADLAHDLCGSVVMTKRPVDDGPNDAPVNLVDIDEPVLIIRWS